MSNQATAASKRYYSLLEDTPGHTVVYVEEGGETRELPRRLDLRDISPSGFSWGYGGSGPHQLGLAILADARGDAFARDYYREFTRKVISTWPQDEALEVNEGEIDAALGVDG